MFRRAGKQSSKSPKGLNRTCYTPKDRPKSSRILYMQKVSFCPVNKL